MEQPLVVLGLVIGLFVLLAGGLHIAFSLGLISAILLLLLEGWGSLPAISTVAYQSTAGFVLTAVPMFILMGELIFHSGVGKELYDMAAKWLGWLPAGLSSATVGACGVFGAMCGASVAGAATIGVVAIPEMQRKGYRTDLCFGAVGAGGALAVMIPPSIPFILYGNISDTSIGALFMAGVLPGVLLMALYIIYNTIGGILRPGAAPREPGVSWADRLNSLRSLGPALVLMLLVLGTIYTGITTPTEAAAVGALGAFIVMMIKQRGFNARVSFLALREATVVSAMLLTILIGAMVFSYVATLAYIPQSVTSWIVSLEMNRWIIFALIWTFLLILGMFLDGVSLILLTTPLVYPVIRALGWDPIWYGVVLVVNVEIAVLTPPVGLNLFVLKGLAPHVPIMTIARGCIPYIIADHVALAILAVFPAIALWLPGTMMKVGG